MVAGLPAEQSHMPGDTTDCRLRELQERLTKAEATVQNLERALCHSRDIGAAIGILMWSQKLTRNEAFELLRMASMQTNRKVHVLALEVLETGALPPT